MNFLLIHQHHANLCANDTHLIYSFLYSHLIGFYISCLQCARQKSISWFYCINTHIAVESEPDQFANRIKINIFDWIFIDFLVYLMILNKNTSTFLLVPSKVLMFISSRAKRRKKELRKMHPNDKIVNTKTKTTSYQTIHTSIFMSLFFNDDDCEQQDIHRQSEKHHHNSHSLTLIS